MSVPVHYADQAVVVSTAAGVAAVRFTDSLKEGRRYEYRFLPAAGGAEQSGRGEVFEKYEREPARPPLKGVVVTDAGGRLRIVAGEIELQWSLGSNDLGWLYYQPEHERVHFVHADDFRTLDLSRFVAR